REGERGSMKSLASLLGRSSSAQVSPDVPGGRPRVRIWTAALLVACASVVGVAAMRQDAPAAPPAKTRFTGDLVTQMALELSKRPHSLEQIASNSPLRQITYDQYRDIRVDSEHAIWRNEQVPFRVDVLPAG